MSFSDSVNTDFFNRKLSLKEIIPYVTHWYYHHDADGKLDYLTAHAELTKLDGLQVTIAQFLALDARFEQFFQAGPRDTEQGYYYGVGVALALAGWRQDLVEVPKDFLIARYISTRSTSTLKITRIHSIEKQNNGSVHLHTTFHMPAELPGGGTYAAASIADGFILPRAWLQENCPAWENRLATAHALDMSDDVLPYYVFGKQELALSDNPAEHVGQGERLPGDVA